MSDLNVSHLYDNDDSFDLDDDIIGFRDGLYLTWSDFWEEIAEAKERCLSTSDLNDIIVNIIKYYGVNITINDLH